MVPFTDKEIYEAVKNNIPKASQYVSSHGGGITLHGVKDATAYIELTGTCSGCSMSLMTTKMVVERELRALIHPELIIVNVDGSPENTLPNDAYVEVVEESSIASYDEKKGLLNKVKDLLHV